jgi:hypothetical protein
LKIENGEYWPMAAMQGCPNILVICLPQGLFGFGNQRFMRK